MDRLKRLIELQEKVSDVIEFRILPNGEEVDDDGHPIEKSAAALGLAGAAGAGLYATGANARGMDLAGTAAMAKQDITGSGGYAISRANALDNLGAGAKRVGQGVKTAGTGLLDSLKVAGTAAKGGRLAALMAGLKKVRFQSRHERLIQLGGKIDGVINA